MNDMVLISGLVVLGVVGVFAVMAGFYGKPATLCEAKVGDVYNFEYLQPVSGDSKRWMARVISPVCRLDDHTIASMNARSSYRRNDPEFQRTNHLVTCKTKNGEVRQFYCERAVNCRKPLFGSLIA